MAAVAPPPAYEKLAGEPPAYDEAAAAPDVERGAVVEEEPETEVELNLRGRCFVNRCCACLSLSTAVWVLGVLDVMRGVFSLLSGAMLLVVKAEEPVIDKMLVGVFASGNATDVVAPAWFPVSANMTALETANAVGGFNHMIDLGVERAVPFLVFAGLMFIFIGYVGLKAAKGDAFCARRYFVWKMIQAIFATLSYGSLASMLFASYVAVVCRSHWVVLVEAEFQEVLSTTTPSAPPAPKAQAPAKTIN